MTQAGGGSTGGARAAGGMRVAVQEVSMEAG
jgi:hypothetical protein